jgi:hypothetical protein
LHGYIPDSPGAVVYFSVINKSGGGVFGDTYADSVPAWEEARPGGSGSPIKWYHFAKKLPIPAWDWANLYYPQVGDKGPQLRVVASIIESEAAPGTLQGVTSTALRLATFALDDTPVGTGTVGSCVAESVKSLSFVKLVSDCAARNPENNALMNYVGLNPMGGNAALFCLKQKVQCDESAPTTTSFNEFRVCAANYNTCLGSCEAKYQACLMEGRPYATCQYEKAGCIVD